MASKMEGLKKLSEPVEIQLIQSKSMAFEERNSLAMLLIRSTPAHLFFDKNLRQLEATA